MILGILQARMSSSRLPGKVLKEILGKPMLAHQISRVQRASMLDKLVVATSTDSSDDAIEALCQKANVECFRGSLDNVLERFYACATHYNADVIVRLTGDNPLADPDVIDGTITYFVNNSFDYVTNAGKEPTFPNGLEAEVFTSRALQTACENASLPSEKEHVTPYIKHRPEAFKLGLYKSDQNNSTLRWTVDEPCDFAFVSRVYEELYPQNPLFSMHDVLELLKSKPELLTINKGIQRNEGFKKSLRQDQEFLKDSLNPQGGSAQ